MTIAYASDSNYAALTAVSAVSALRHNPGARIVLLGYGIEVSARELVDGYVDGAESGVRGYGGRFDIRPAYQREFEYMPQKRRRWFGL